VRWALQDRRRDAAVAGWGGSELALSGGSAGPEVAWAPADSDRLYRLAVLPPEHARIAAADLFRAAPMPVDGALSLVGAGERGALVLAAEGGERGLVLRPWDEGADGAHRIRSLWLGPAEEFSGRGLASAERALFATDRGLYLFDRARELYLADYEPLAPLRDATRGSAPSAGGDVFATRDLVLVVGPEGAWIFRVE